MNDRQTSKLNMYDAVMQFLNTYPEVWSDNPTISAIVLSFSNHLDALNASDLLQKTSTVGITQNKTAAKEAMANAAILAAKAGFAHANVIKDIELAAQFKVSLSEIKAAKDTDADDICQNIHNALQPHVSHLQNYGVNAATQVALQQAIDAFSALIGKPKSVASVSINATLSIEQHFEAADNILLNQLDPIFLQFEVSNSAFYNQYNAVRVVG